MNVIFINLYPQKKRSDSVELKGYLQMKRIIRIFVLLLVIGSLMGITTSCAIFDESSHAQKLHTFKHSKPLPKKYILDNGYKPIAK